jgi:hypothetical protein
MDDGDNSSNDDESIGDGGFSGDSGEEDEEKKTSADTTNLDIINQLTIKETSAVWTWKFLVLSAYGLCAGFMSAGFYNLIQSREENDFMEEVNCVPAFAQPPQLTPEYVTHSIRK